MSDQKKASLAQMQATARYEAVKYDKILVRFPKGTKDRILSTGSTLNGYIVRSTLTQLDKDKPVE